MCGALDESRMLDGEGDFLLSDELDDVGADCD